MSDPTEILDNSHEELDIDSNRLFLERISLLLAIMGPDAINQDDLQKLVQQELHALIDAFTHFTGGSFLLMLVSEYIILTEPVDPDFVHLKEISVLMFFLVLNILAKATENRILARDRFVDVRSVNELIIPNRISPLRAAIRRFFIGDATFIAGHKVIQRISRSK